MLREVLRKISMGMGIMREPRKLCNKYPCRTHEISAVPSYDIVSLKCLLKIPKVASDLGVWV